MKHNEKRDREIQKIGQEQVMKFKTSICENNRASVRNVAHKQLIYDEAT
jgi:hypothetical protein